MSIWEEIPGQTQNTLERSHLAWEHLGMTQEVLEMVDERTI